jgi:Protein of unknown function (DUF3455)
VGAALGALGCPAETIRKTYQAVDGDEAGPHWESTDGSKVAGTVKESTDAPQADGIPWLLLDTKSVGSQTRLPSHKYRRLHLNLPGSPEGSAYSAAGTRPPPNRQDHCKEAVQRFLGYRIG